jgi:putative ABC transport system ATP-binding protein
LPTETEALAPSELAASCDGVVKIYYTQAGEVSALRGVDLEFPAGAVSAVVGPSGSGKSSLLRIIGGFDRPTAGRVRLGPDETSGLRAGQLRKLRRRSVGYVFQRPADNLVPYLSVVGHLKQAARIRNRTDAWQNEAEEILHALGLTKRAAHLPRQLSGGEQQRLAFAAASMGKPVLVIADEPTGELDSESTNDLLRSVASLAHRRTAFIIATHDPAVVSAAGRTYHLRHGSVEAESKNDRSLSVIDAAGRIQLPPKWNELFPAGRAQIVVEDGGMRIIPP